MDKLIQTLMVIGLLMFGVPAHADDHEAGAVKEAWMEAQLWTTYALNQHLNPFDLQVDVDNDTAILEGEVDEKVKKELAEQIALSVDGIDRVKNRIKVNEDLVADRSAMDGEEGRSFGDRVRDATTTATVKSKLLWNRSTSGLAINVTTKNGVVELDGEAESAASRELAERLAANTEGVDKVVNNIQVITQQQARAF